MNLKSLTNKFRRIKSKVKIKGSKHSSDLALIGGIGLGIGAAVKACHDTEKFYPIKKKFKKQKKELKKMRKEKKALDLKRNKVVKYAKEMYQNDLKQLYLDTGIKAVKNYAISLGMGAGSIGLILFSNNLLKKRTIQLGAALASVTNQFGDYRSRVVEKYGKDEDIKLLHGIKTKEVEIEEIDENGNSTIKKETYNYIDNHTQYDYGILFAKSTSDAWIPGGWSANMMLVDHVEQELNQLNRLDGFVFGNKMHEWLKIRNCDTRGKLIYGTYGGTEVGWTFENLTGKADIDAYGHTKISLNPTKVWHRIKDGDAIYPYNDGPDVMDFRDPEHWEKAILINPNYEGSIRDALYTSKRA